MSTKPSIRHTVQSITAATSNSLNKNHRHLAKGQAKLSALDVVVAAGVISLLHGQPGAKTIASRISGFVNTSKLQVTAYRAYDNWKHQINEVTEITSDKHFHQMALATSQASDHEYEYAVVETMAAVFRLDEEIDHSERKKFLSTLIAMQTDIETKAQIFRIFNRNRSFVEFDTSQLSIALKTELYLTIYMNMRNFNERENRFLKSFSEHLELPSELVRQIHFQASLQGKAA